MQWVHGYMRGLCVVSVEFASDNWVWRGGSWRVLISCLAADRLSDWLACPAGVFFYEWVRLCNDVGYSPAQHGKSTPGGKIEFSLLTTVVRALRHSPAPFFYPASQGR